MLELFDKNILPDVVTVLDEMKRKGIGGEKASAYLVSMAEAVPSTRNILEYASLVADTSRRVDARQKTAELLDMLGNRGIGGLPRGSGGDYEISHTYHGQRHLDGGRGVFGILCEP